MADAAHKVGKAAGNRGKGRKKGVPNKTTALLKDAIVRAAELQGRDGEGMDGLVGYCQYLATCEPKAFASLMGRVLPTQVTGEDGGPVQSVTRIELVAPGHDDGAG